MKPRYGGMGGGLNMSQIMKQAQKMQQDMAKKQEELKEREYTATAGGGVVSVTLKGSSLVSSIKLSAEVVDPDDIDTLEELIVTAVNDALKTARETEESEMQKLTGGLSI